MAIFDRIRDTTTTTATLSATTTFTVSGSAPSGFQTFSARFVSSPADSNIPVVIAHQTLNEWQVAWCSYTASNTLRVDTIIASSNSDNGVTFSAGTKDVFVANSSKAIAALREANTFTGNNTFPNTGLKVQDTDASHVLTLASGALTANRTLTLTTGSAADRTLDISAANVTISTAGAALIDDADAAAQRTTLGLAIGTNVQAYDADLAALAGLSTNGMIARTGAGTAAVRTITAGSNISVANGDGVSGNPTVALANMAANTIKGNATGGSAAPSDITCTAAGFALLDDATTLAQQGTLGFFDTVAAVNAATIDSTVNHIRTAGYYANGDGGGALYKKSSGTPPGYITSNSGATVWEVVGTDVNVNQFGAYSNQTNASTTTAAIQAAINHVLAKTNGSGGTVRFLPGNYLIDDVITIASSVTYPTINSLSIVGAGAQASQIIQGTGTEAKHCFNFDGSYASDSIQYCSVTDLKIVATVTKTAGAGVRISDGFHCAVENCRMAGLFIGIDNRHSAWTKIRYNRMTDLVNSTGVGLLWEGGTGVFCEYNVIDNSTTTPYAGFLYRDVGTARSGYHTQGGVTRGNQVLRCQYGLLLEGKAAITSEAITFSASGGHILGTHTTDLRDYTEVVFATTGSMPTGLTAGVTYYTKRQSATTSKFATSLANAVAGTFINHTNNGSSVTLAVGAKQEWQFFDQNAWDTCTVNTCKIETTGNGEIRGLFFVGEWFGTASEHGVYAAATGGNVRNLQFTGPVVKNNGQHGMIFVNCADVLISNPLVTGNSAASSGTYNGIVFSGNSARINVVGGLSRQSGQFPNSQAYGIVVGASVTEYRILNTDCSTNVTGTILAESGASRGSIPMHGNINQLGTQTWNGNATINGTLTLNTTNLQPVTIISNDNSANGGPAMVLDRESASPAANDVIGAFQFWGRNSTPSALYYAGFDTTIVTATAGLEDSRLRFLTRVGGAVTAPFTVEKGVIVGAPTGGDKGAGTLNATNLYVNNTLVPLPNVATTWTATQTSEKPWASSEDIGDNWQFSSGESPAITLANGASKTIAAGTGLLLVANTTDGKIALYTTGGAIIRKVDGDAIYVTGAPGAGQIGVEWTGTAYRLTNNMGGSRDFYVGGFRIRPGN